MMVSLILSAASLILVGFSFLFFLAYLRRRTGAERILEEFREEVDKLIAEIDAATDRDAVLVEDRIKSLRNLLAEADKRITTYARELDRRRSQENAYAELGRNRLKSSPLVSSPEESVPVQSVSPGFVVAPPVVSFEPMRATAPEQKNTSSPPARQDRISPEIPAERVHEKDSLAPQFVRSVETIKPRPPSFRERAAELYRAGFSPDLIASRLGATVAEVELAIALAEHRTFPD